MKRALLLRPARRRDATSTTRGLSTLRNRLTKLRASSGACSAASSSLRRPVLEPMSGAFIAAGHPRLDQRRSSTGASSTRPRRMQARRAQKRSVTQMESFELTMDTFRNHPNFPTEANLKGMGVKSTTEFMDNLPQYLGNKLPAKTKETAVAIRRGGITGHSNTLSVEWQGHDWEPISVVGEGQSIKHARRAAWYNLVKSLHEEGILSRIMAVSNAADTKITEAELKREQRAFVDVYDYCVRYGYLPEVTREIISKTKRRRGSQRTSISLPAQNIEVEAFSSKGADNKAAILFKRQAEAYHKAQGTESLVVKAHDSLNTSNSDEFFTFYKLKNSNRLTKDVIVEDVEDSSDLYAATVLLNNEPVGPTIEAGRKKDAELLAKLAAAYTIIQKQPGLKAEFLDALREGNGSILKPLSNLDLPVDDTAVLLMRDTLAKARESGLPDEYQKLEAEKVDESEFTFGRPHLSEDMLSRRNDILKQAKERYEKSVAMEQVRTIRSSLPMVHHAAQVLEIIDKSTFSIIIGETGSGKTTQVPQILLDHSIDQGIGANCDIICTQPRRIAATSVARRVAAERGEALGNSIGYQVRGDRKRADFPGSINFCTTGVLLAQLQNDPDRIMESVSHIVLDEVHERDTFLDFTMIMLKQIVMERLSQGKKVPKVVLMSATLDPSLFAPYFETVQEDGSTTEAPVLRVPGRTFPVTEQYLGSLYEDLKSTYGREFQNHMAADRFSEEYMDIESRFRQENPSADDADNALASAPASIINWRRDASTDSGDNSLVEAKVFPKRLVTATIAHIAKTTSEGAILVFLPGWEEISTVQKELQASNIFGVDFRDENKFALFTLHSSISESQKSVFDLVPQGMRKVILSTNIAETSVTIPDVQYVVDTGKARETQYDQRRRITSLTATWVSKSNAKQRAGRAGRVQNGHYYALYTKSRADSFRSVGLPELLRSDLAETCLSVVAQKWPTPPQEFLAAAMEPPDASEVEDAMHSLAAIDAITADEEITPLGRLLSSLPVHPELGKMVVLGIIFKCLDPMIILGACQSSRSIFAMSPTREGRAEVDRISKHFSAGSNSDHMAQINAFREIRQLQNRSGIAAARSWAMSNHLHWGAYKAIEQTAIALEQALIQARIIPLRSAHHREDEQYGGGEMNSHSRKTYVIKAIAAAGLFPRLAVRQNPRIRTWRTHKEADVTPFPSSVNAEGWGARTLQDNVDPRSAQFAVFSELAKSASGQDLFFRTNTFVSPLAITLFCGRLAARSGAGSVAQHVVMVDKWIPFYIQSDDRLAVRTLIETRKALERMLVRAYADLSKRKNLAADPVRTVFAEGIVHVLGMDLCQEGQERSHHKDGSEYDSRLAWDRVKENMRGGSPVTPYAKRWDQDEPRVDPTKFAPISSRLSTNGGAGQAIRAQLSQRRQLQQQRATDLLAWQAKREREKDGKVPAWKAKIDYRWL